MTLVTLADGWKRFGTSSTQWRCRQPHFLLEQDMDGNCPMVKPSATLSKVAQVKTFLSKNAFKFNFGQLNQYGTAIDILTANTFAESLGTIPSDCEYEELKQVFNKAKEASVGERLNEVVAYVERKEKMLVRREPNYKNPIETPNRLSMGAHHVLISTALGLLGKAGPRANTEETVIDLVLKLPSQSIFATELAIMYFNNSARLHQYELPLMAATYNAGSPRAPKQAAKNKWNLVCHGDHIDRWIQYYNTSRQIIVDQTPTENGKLQKVAAGAVQSSIAASKVA